jgi:hypothetical protein
MSSVALDAGLGFEAQEDFRSSSKKSVACVSAPGTFNWVGLGTGIRRDHFQPVEGSLSRAKEASLLGLRNQSVHQQTATCESPLNLCLVEK